MSVRRFGAIALAAVVAATACSGPPRVAQQSPSPSASAQNSPESSPTTGKVTWTACGAYQCGSVTVPLDYSNPDNGTIDIALIKEPATNPSRRIGSLLVNPGGPGASGIEFVKQSGSMLTSLNVRFDIIGFDPRGVGASAPIRCLSGPEEDAYNEVDPVADDAGEKQALIDADKAFAAGCEKRSGRVLPFVDTVSAARDIDAIREAVGDAKLTYLGFSYGTFLGETYAHLFPDHIRALVLDGVLDPSLNANDLLYAQIVSFEQNLKAFFTDCQSKPSCKWGQSGDPYAKLMALMNELDTKPLIVSGRKLTRSIAIIGVLTPLYEPDAWPALDAGLTSAANGDGSTLMRFADLYLERNADGTYSNQNDANSAINCLDRPVQPDLSYYDGLAAQYAQASQLFGPAEQYGNLLCAFWPVPATGTAGPITADTAPPIVLVGGTGDPATPYAWAQSVHKQLTSSVLVTREGQGHVSYDKSVCVKRLVDAYLISLTVPADGTTCTA